MPGPSRMDPPAGTPRASQRAVPLLTWRLERGSSSREASQPGACILDSLSFMPLMSLCSPQALQSLGRLSSWSDFSGASEAPNDTCNGAIVLGVWRGEGPRSRAPAPPSLGNCWGRAAPHSRRASRMQ